MSVQTKPGPTPFTNTRGDQAVQPVLPQAAKMAARWEYMSLIVWDDDPKSQVSSDIEDVEVLNTLGAEGWELVCVVPLARTQVLEMAYPGNTRKLLAYLKRAAH
jgi:uncharacterized protein YqjF (DUF2071 family)